ncbi:RHS repeat-associated core domain-containing protein [Enterobacter ludwigii]
MRWETVNSAWGKLLRESETQLSGYSQNLRMQRQYLDRETGLYYICSGITTADCGRFTQQDPIGLAGGINLYQYAPNALGWMDPWGLSRKCKDPSKEATQWQGPLNKDYKGIDSTRTERLKKERPSMHCIQMVISYLHIP